MTKREKTKKLILIIFLLLICSFLIFYYQKTLQKENSIPISGTSINQTPIANSGILTTLLVNNVQYKTSIDKQINVYDFMSQLQKEGKINFKSTTYTGMGKFIEEINGIKNDKNKYWIYYVNNKKANIGVSNYKINPGDVVSWKYESNY